MPEEEPGLSLARSTNAKRVVHPTTLWAMGKTGFQRPGNSPRIVSILLLAVGAVLGSLSRYTLIHWIHSYWGQGFPYGTLLVNALGSFILGFFLTAAPRYLVIGPGIRLLVATGFCGSFTTFSSFSYETAVLIQIGEYSTALSNVLAGLGAGIIAVFAGIVLARTIFKGQ